MSYAFEAFLTLGQIYQQERELNNAIRCFKAALSYDPENVDVLLLLGTAQFEAKKFGTTIKSTQLPPFHFILLPLKELRERERERKEKERQRKRKKFRKLVLFSQQMVTHGNNFQRMQSKFCAKFPFLTPIRSLQTSI
jgi:tetratricopeptide (TPR) repeat protein